MSELMDRLQTALGSAYRLERELTHGGMSRVYLATEVQLARQVVVKVLPPESATPTQAERFAREIQLFVREHLSAYAYPRAIEFVDDLPKTLTGKIRRIELREREAARAAADRAS